MHTNQLYKKFYAFIALFMLCAQISWGATAIHEDINAIRLGAKNFLETLAVDNNKNPKQILISKIDTRLRLTKCATPLKYELYGKQNLTGRITLKASCESQNWFLYLAAQIKEFQKIIVAKQSIPRNTYLMPSYITLVEKDIGELRTGYFTDIKNIMGAKLIRSIRAGEVITPQMVKLKQLVNKGDKISIISKTAFLEVKIPGIALQSGNLGQQILVKNSKSGKELKAVVIDNYKVSVDF